MPKLELVLPAGLVISQAGAELESHAIGGASSPAAAPSDALLRWLAENRLEPSQAALLAAGVCEPVDALALHAEDMAQLRLPAVQLRLLGDACGKLRAQGAGGGAAVQAK